MFCNANFRNLNLVNFLQRKRKTDRFRECVFRASGGTDFESFSGCNCDGYTTKNQDHLKLNIIFS